MTRIVEKTRRTLPVADAIQAAAPETDGIMLGELGRYIGFRMRRIQNHLSRDFSELTRGMALRSGTVSALGIIYSNPGINQVRVARAIGQDPSAAVALFDDLRKRGWVNRVRHSQDRRHYAIRLTATGEAAYHDLLAALAKVEERFLQNIDPGQQEALSSLLDQLFELCQDAPQAD